MKKLEEAQKRVDLLEKAIFALKEFVDHDRKVSHNKHIDKQYKPLFEKLELDLTGARAYLARVEILEK